MRLCVVGLRRHFKEKPAEVFPMLNDRFSPLNEEVKNLYQKGHEIPASTAHAASQALDRH